MNKRTTILSVLVCASLVGAGYVRAATSKPEAATTAAVQLQEKEFQVAMAFLKAETSNLKGESSTAELRAAREKVEGLANLLDKAPRDAKTSQAMIERALWLFHMEKSKDLTNVTVSAQAAAEPAFRLQLLAVQQNRRIIELLEELTKK
jgi:hypothetical protein